MKQLYAKVTSNFPKSVVISNYYGFTDKNFNTTLTLSVQFLLRLKTFGDFKENGLFSNENLNG